MTNNWTDKLKNPICPYCPSLSFKDFDELLEHTDKIHSTIPTTKKDFKQYN